MSNINLRLYKMRRHLKVSQAEFGATGAVSQSTQNRYEQNADIPISYLNKIYEEYGASINQDWFFFGKGEMLSSDNKLALISNFSELSVKETQIIDGVIQFSNLLKEQPLHPEVKRHLLELLIEYIDQALTKLSDNKQRL